MNDKKFDKKLLKRCEFLRKLLERYGIKWKIKLEIINNVETVMSFFPTFNGLYLNYDTINLLSVRLYGEDRFYSEKELDLEFNLTQSTLRRFYDYGKTNSNLKEYKKVRKILENITVYSNRVPYAYAIEGFDFEGIIQNMILDGISIDDLPNIEEIL